MVHTAPSQKAQTNNKISERSDTDQIKATGGDSWNTDHTPASGFITPWSDRGVGAETGYPKFMGLKQGPIKLF